jgi:hypothetical protein
MKKTEIPVGTIGPLGLWVSTSLVYSVPESIHAQVDIQCRSCGDMRTVAASGFMRNDGPKTGCFCTYVDPRLSSPSAVVIGSRFGNVLVIEPPYPDKDRIGRNRWLVKVQCQCAAKTVFITRTQNLTNGDCQSCGCHRKDPTRNGMYGKFGPAHPAYMKTSPAKERSKWLAQKKAVGICPDCVAAGRDIKWPPESMQFDHVPELEAIWGTRAFSLNECGIKGRSIAECELEYKKGEFVCAGCHAVRTKYRPTVRQKRRNNPG